MKLIDTQTVKGIFKVDEADGHTDGKRNIQSRGPTLMKPIDTQTAKGIFKVD